MEQEAIQPEHDVANGLFCWEIVAAVLWGRVCPEMAERLDPHPPCARGAHGPLVSGCGKHDPKSSTNARRRSGVRESVWGAERRSPSDQIATTKSAMARATTGSCKTFR
jgi:hypothetical protein